MADTTSTPKRWNLCLYFRSISADSILKIFNYNPYHYSLMLRFVLLLFQPRSSRSRITFTIHMIFPFPPPPAPCPLPRPPHAFSPFRNPVTCPYTSLRWSLGFVTSALQRRPPHHLFFLRNVPPSGHVPEKNSLPYDQNICFESCQKFVDSNFIFW